MPLITNTYLALWFTLFVYSINTFHAPDAIFSNVSYVLCCYQKNCVDTIRNVANVCCVQFSPYSSRMLAFGSADYKTYCYDLRHTRIPWCTISGHGKAVSYVRFLDPETLITASTDNTLKIWDLNRTNSNGLSTSACSLTLSGHTNEKV